MTDEDGSPWQMTAVLWAAAIAPDPGGSEAPCCSMVEFVLAGLVLSIAATAATAAACLLTYSPTKLAKIAGAPVELDPDEEDAFLVATGILATVAAVAAGVLAWHGAGSRALVALAVMLVLGGLVCGVLPARIAQVRAERVVLALLPALRVLRTVLDYPVIRPAYRVSGWLLALARVPRQPPTDPDEIADEILAAVSDSAREAELQEEERGWIENIVEFKDQVASAVMTPRTDVVAFPRDTPLLEAVRQANQHGFSRYPVYEGRIDQVIGLFYAKDALGLLANGGGAEQATVGDLVRRPLFVSESARLVDLLRQFRLAKVQMAVVQDEYGGTAGLVTVEDVLEEIVGDMEDEYDPEGELPIVEIRSGEAIEVSGRTRVDEANEHLDDAIPEGDDYDTVAGWVFSQLDRIPRTGEVIRLQNVDVEILEADQRRIGRMQLRRVDGRDAGEHHA